MLVVMTMIHLPGVCGQFLDELFGFVGSADGLVFLSGLLVGIRYSKQISSLGFQRVKTKLHRRAFQIYIAQVSIVLLLILLSVLAPSFAAGWKEFVVSTGEAPLSSAFSSLLLMYQPRYLDILIVFFGLFLVAPYAVRGFHEYRHRVVLCLSVGAWLLAQFFDVGEFAFRAAQSMGMIFYSQSPFNFFAWQLLFVLGIYFGWRKPSVNSSRFVSMIGVTFALTIVFTFTLWRHGYISSSMSASFVELLVAKKNLGFLRIVELLCIAYIVRLFCIYFPKKLQFSWLSLLGRSPIEIYIAHTVILYCTASVRNDWHFSWPIAGQVFATLAVFSFLTLIALIAEKKIFSFSTLFASRKCTEPALQGLPLYEEPPSASIIASQAI